MPARIRKARKPSKSSPKRSIQKHSSSVVGEARRKSRSPRFSKLTARQRAARNRTLALLADLRTRRDTYTRLLRQHRVSTRTAHKYLGPHLRGGSRRGDPVRASKSDRMLRELLFPTSLGDVPMRIRGSRDASRLSEFFQDRDKLLRGKLSAHIFEAKWRGVRIAGQEVFADTTTIIHMANAGDLKVENLYASTAGAR
jgi:hypothetical protein